jgi:hypothetical protein
MFRGERLVVPAVARLRFSWASRHRRPPIGIGAVTLATLQRRRAYGGRKGRSAARRIGVVEKIQRALDIAT